MVHALARQHGLAPTVIADNEFGEQSFVMTGPDGVSWQILEAPELANPPVLELEFVTCEQLVAAGHFLQRG